MASSTVRVALRIRPLSPQEHLDGETECVTQLPGVPQIVIGADRAFTFDYVFSPEASQEQVYSDAIQPLVVQFLQGYNATVLAYGGKTFSMGTGLAVSASNLDIQGGFTYNLDVSFLELYNEDLIDLLNPRSIAGNGGRGPTIREDSRGNMVLVGVERKPAGCEEDIIRYLHQGALSRTTASTDMNRTSSRSHAIFTIYLRQQERRGSTTFSTNGSSTPATIDQITELDGGPLIVSKIHFVDLAGSERIKRTGAAGDRAKEGISINAGLLALGNVVSALGGSASNPNGTSQLTKRAVHVPYRDSKLTRLLQDSLGGNSQTIMLACISPSDKNSNESLNTIRYANRARNIRNKIAVNFDKNSSVELNMLKTEVARLRGELSNLKLQRRQSSMSLLDTTLESGNMRYSVETSRFQNRIAELSQKLDKSLHRVVVLERERDLLRAQVVSLGGSIQSTAPLLPPNKLPEYDSMASSTTPASQLDEDNLMMSRANMLDTLDRELSEQAERHEQQIGSVRCHYESKLELVQEALSVVQKERDVALQRLANAKKPNAPTTPYVNASIFKRSSLTNGGSSSSSSSSSNSNASSSNRKALGVDSAATTNATPTKLRLPSRASKNAHNDVVSSPVGNAGNTNKNPPSVTRKKSSVDLRSASKLSPLHEDAAERISALEDEIRRLKAKNKSVNEYASADTERLTLQIQDQAKEISRLRRQRTGRRESKRYSLLALKESSWTMAKTASSQVNEQGDSGGPNLLRAAFIKAVIENELQRCVQARQLLRERDSYLNRQDELMNEQNDLLLRIQNIDLELDDEYGSDQMQRATERIEIIDAELNYLDLKVRDAEAEVAQLAEAAPSSNGCQCGNHDNCNCGNADLNASGLLATPAIINMSGLAMRMVEDVVRIDYRAFSGLFESLPSPDSTGLSYLLMQDIIELRLLANNDKRDKAFLEEQIMDLRRTLLAMQKTALNAALTYERELGDAEQKLDQLRLPMAADADFINESDQQCQHDSQEPLSTLRGTGAGLDLEQISNTRLNVMPSLERLPSDRSVYDGVRDRGILLRSALMGAADVETDLSFSSGVAEMHKHSNSMEDIRGAKAHVVDLTDNISDFGSLGINNLPEYANQSFAYPNSVAIAESSGASDDDNATSGFADATDIMEPLEQMDPRQVGRPSGIRISITTTTEAGSTPSVTSASISDISPGTRRYTDQTTSRNSASSPIESDASYLDDNTNAGSAARTTERADPLVSANNGGGCDSSKKVEVLSNHHSEDEEEMFFSNPEMSDAEEDEVPELYRSGSGEFFRLPNLTRNTSIRSQSNQHRFHRPNRRNSHRHLIRRISIRKNGGVRTNNHAATYRFGVRRGSKRRGSLRKARIGRPIVPPEMMEYIDKCNPSAIRVGDTDPIIGSPEVLRAMKIYPTNEYQENIAAFASFAVRKKKSAHYTLKPDATSNLQPKEIEQIADTAELQEEPIAHNVFIPRSAGKIRSRIDVINCRDMEHEAKQNERLDDIQTSDTSTHAQVVDYQSNVNSPISETVTGATSQSQLRSPTLFYQKNSPYLQNGQISSSPVAPVGEQPEDVFKACQYDIRAMLAVPINNYTTKDPLQYMFGDDIDYGAIKDSQKAADNSGIQPRNEDVNDNFADADSAHAQYFEAKPQPPSAQKHRYLSPTEKANASLFSMLDAARTSAVKFEDDSKLGTGFTNNRNSSRGPHGQSPQKNTNSERNSQYLDSQYSSRRNSYHLYGSPMQTNFESKATTKETSRSAGAKPSRIRRRTLAVFEENTEPASDRANSSQVSVADSNNGFDKQGGSRLSKILSGIGFGGGKNGKSQQNLVNTNNNDHISQLLSRPASTNPGGVVSSVMLDIGRDRSISDSTGSRISPIRKVHSTIDGVITELRRDKWLAVNPSFAAAASAAAFSAGGDLSESSSNGPINAAGISVSKRNRFYTRRSSAATTSMYN
ncbi:hypothetical protein GGI25_002160 [Coemansia spiralis]|uniref:Kinesin motor domain-containing protein n=1 Tax=Coemansia spiralis TaxID=417178 RepID=A0A9W8G9D2_9FUNG|nr:hypothetical protein GGI25_002160 [Coemansia spiralis]